MIANQQFLENQQELERRALHGIMCEWKLAVSHLPESLRQRMRPPIFVLKEFTHPWGRWNKESREIAIRKSLFLEYPWVSVRDVLLHEMAHQMADEVLGGEPAPHGDLFRKSCKPLRADPSATGDYAPLTDVLHHGNLSGDDRILLRIKKLLALAQSSNRHEAEAAMAKAHEHITKYNIDLLATQDGRAYCSVCIGKPVGRRLDYDLVLACLLCDFDFVEGIWISAYVLEKERMGKVLEISGTPENVKMAGYVDDFLRRVIDEQWHAYNSNDRFSYHRKTDFAVGLVKGFRQKLEIQARQWQTTDKSSWALITTGDTRLKEYFRQRYSRIRRNSGRSRMVDMKIQQAGEKAGQATILSRPIEANNGSRRLLLRG